MSESNKKVKAMKTKMSEAHTLIERMHGKIMHALKDGSKYEAQRVLREILFDLGKIYKKGKK